MIQEHLLDTLNIVIGCVENFLERSEKKIHLQKQGFFEHFEPFSEVVFLKMFEKILFLKVNFLFRSF